MTLPSGEERFNIYEIRFKNGRKHFFKNVENLTLSMGDVVAVESSPGHDIGTISLGGELVKVQMKKRAPTKQSGEKSATHKLEKTVSHNGKTTNKRFKNKKRADGQTKTRTGKKLGKAHETNDMNKNN